MSSFRVLLILILAHVPYVLSAQTDSVKTSVVSHFIRIEYKLEQSRDYKKSKLDGFYLEHTDSTSGKKWTSDLLTPLDKNSDGYLVRLDVPDSLVTKIGQMKCTAKVVSTYEIWETVSSQDSPKSNDWGGGDETDDPYDSHGGGSNEERVLKEIKEKVNYHAYGGVELSKIELTIETQPKGADTYLIPNRIWKKNFEGKGWENNLSVLNDFRVNTSLTNTTVFIDQTVYMVVLKLEDKVEIRKHKTLAQSVQPVQKVAVKF